MVVDPRNGYVVCSIKLPAKGVTNLAFGGCPNDRSGKLICVYVTSGRAGLSSPTADDGAVFLIEGIDSVGVLPDKVRMNEIEKSERTACGHGL